MMTEQEFIETYCIWCCWSEWGKQCPHYDFCFKKRGKIDETANNCAKRP